MKKRLEEIEARKLEIRNEVEALEDEAKIEELNKEVDALNDEVKEINEKEKLEKEAQELEQKSSKAKEIKLEERKEMKEEKEEFRNSKEYINAFAEYIKTNNAEELRALVTTQGLATGNSNTVEVPDMVYDIVKTAWEREDLMARVRTLSVKGNLKVQFEVSGTPAVEHQEGSGAVTEEELVLGVVQLTPISIKKWLSISDEVISMRSEEFLRYIYDEITYRIAKKCADTLVAKIAALPQTLVANSDGVYDKVSANKITKAPAIGLVAESVANLSDEANELTIVMNKLTFSDFKAIQYANGYAVDPFEGIKVVFNNTLPAYSAATSGQVYMIVGDFNNGALANYPDGEGIEMKYDDTTLMTSDLVRILGRRYVGIEPVADKRFTLVAKPASI